jgi:hypothetical protein
MDTSTSKTPSAVSEHQHIDIAALEQYWRMTTPETENERMIKSMHIELLDLVRETGFLNNIEQARKDLAKEY